MLLFAIAAVCFMVSSTIFPFRQTAADENQFDTLKILQEMSNSFKKQTDEQCSIIAQLRVKAGESFYVPPDSDHVAWNENEQHYQSCSFPFFNLSLDRRSGYSVDSISSIDFIVI